MKIESQWKPTKYEYRKGRLRANKDYVGDRSIFIADIVAGLYDNWIKRTARGNLLDLGCGTVPFYESYKPYVKTITCMDWKNCTHDINHIDKAVDLNIADFPANSYDTIILSDVLEHIYKPHQLLERIYNSLKQNGILLLNTPFTYWEHEVPYDYFRYTRYWYERTAKEIGFEIINITAIGNDNYAVMIDILSKTLEQKNTWYDRVLLRLIKCLRKHNKSVCLNEPLGYFAVLKKK